MEGGLLPLQRTRQHVQESGGSDSKSFNEALVESDEDFEYYE
jgi:hypothetical protein